jgi:hypothetical protein
MFRTVKNDILFDGDLFLFRGVSLKDIGQETNAVDKIKQIRLMGANSIRLPVYTQVSKDTKDISANPWKPNSNYLEKVLEPIVSEALGLGLKVVIDLHIIHDMNAQTLGVAKQFWREAAPKFTDPNIVFEVFNEPINADCLPIVKASLIKSWNQYIPFMNELVYDIRQLTDKLLLVGTPLMCNDLSPSIMIPVKGENIAYTAHLYPPEHPTNSESVFLREVADFKFRTFQQIGTCRMEHPVVITETGWTPEMMSINPKYERELDYTMGLNSWFAWVFDDKWWPPMLNHGGEGLSRFGREIQRLLSFK